MPGSISSWRQRRQRRRQQWTWVPGEIGDLGVTVDWLAAGLLCNDSRRPAGGLCLVFLLYFRNGEYKNGCDFVDDVCYDCSACAVGSKRSECSHPVDDKEILGWSTSNLGWYRHCGCHHLCDSHCRSVPEWFPPVSSSLYPNRPPLPSSSSS